jgi:hypothetical protein
MWVRAKVPAKAGKTCARMVSTIDTFRFKKNIPFGKQKIPQTSKKKQDETAKKSKKRNFTSQNDRNQKGIFKKKFRNDL